MDFGCKLFNQGRETKFWAAALLMWFSILGKTRGNLHTSEYLPGSDLRSKSNNIQIICVSVRELGIDLRNCVSSNPHFFLRDRSRDRSLGLWQIGVGGRWQTTWEVPRLCRKVLWLWWKEQCTSAHNKVERYGAMWRSLAMQCKLLACQAAIEGGQEGGGRAQKGVGRGD